jgi:PIN domain nuclease of toxin-antitoxin system
MKELRGLLQPRTPVREWPRLLGRIHNFEILDVDTDVWIRAAELDWPHRDPADRIIASTALRLGVAVLTKDRVFHSADSPVDAVW